MPENNMDLYLDAALPETEKTAGSEVTLPEDANAWPNEIMQELYKQVPYVADFDPHVVMDRVDAERGYGFGHVEVGNKTELQQGAAPEALQAVGVHQVRIPIIVKERKLMSFDVLVTEDSKMLPLTENRIRQALFRPQAFDVTSRTPGDMSMVGQLYPPYRQNFGGGGGAGAAAGMGKDGSASTGTEQHFAEKLQRVIGLSDKDVAKLKGEVKLQDLGKHAATNIPNSTAVNNLGPSVKKLMPKLASILSAISGSINEADLDKFASVIADRHLQAAYILNKEATHVALSTILNSTPTTTEKIASALPNMIRPDVVQILKAVEGYTVKTANHAYWAPHTYDVNREQLVKSFGEKVALAADATGSVTLSDGPDAHEGSPEEHNAELISRFGMYKVKSTDGKELVGFVFPNLLDMDGTALPITLFSNGSQSALQGEIAGEPAGDGKNPPSSEPHGHGVFFRTRQNGSVEATIPMEILGSHEGDGHKFHVELFDSRQVFVSLIPGVQHPMGADEGSFVLPGDCKWMPLGDNEEVALVEHPSDFHKAASAIREFASVTVRAGGDNIFSLSGYYLDKIASDQREFMSVDETLFLLGGLGTDLGYATTKLAEAIHLNAPVQIRVGRAIKLASEARSEATKLASDKLSLIPYLRRDLFKEAAYIPDPIAVDSVLSVGFINPENIMTFVGYLPHLDEAQAKLCELLVSSRLGLQDVPANSLQKCIKSLEEVIEGLRVLAFQKN